MVGTLAMVLPGIAGRLLDFHVPGTDAYAGYCMAAAGFLALAHTLKRGEHIRVTLILEHLGATRAARARAAGRSRVGHAARGAVRVLQRPARLAVVAVQRHLDRQRRDAAVDPAARDGGRHARPADRVRRRARPRVAGRRAARRPTKRCTTNDAHGERMDALITTLLIVALFVLLGSGVWIGLALAGVAWIGMELFTSRPGRRRDGGDDLGLGVVVDADRAAAVRLDGRDPVPHAAVRGHVPRPRALARAAARAGCCTPTSSAARSSPPCRARPPRPARRSAR